MNVFNRAVVILEVLSLIVLLIISAVVPNTVLERLLYTAEVAKASLESRWPLSYLLFLAVAVVLILLLVVVLWLELRPRAKKAVAVRNVKGAKAEVGTASVEQSLQYRISEIADILKVRATVQGRRGGVGIQIDLETTPEIDVPAKTAEVTQAARDVVEGKMGLKVADIKVRIKHAAYGKVRPTSAPIESPVNVPSAQTFPGMSQPVVLPVPPEDTGRAAQS
jgi:hypothetical protein